MKTLAIVCLWCAALGVALWLLLRVRGRRPVVLTGRLTPGLARMVVILLVALGVSADVAADEPEPNPPPAGKPAADVPSILNRETMSAWRRMEARFRAFKRVYAQWRLTGKQDPLPDGKLRRGMSLPAGLQRLVAAEVEARRAGTGWPERTAAQLRDVLDEAERGGFVDPFTASLLWRWTRVVHAPVPGAAAGDLVRLLGRLALHARMANALTKAKAEVKPVALPPRAWMGKAGPKREDLQREQAAQRDLLEVARRHFPQMDAAPLATEARVELRVLADSGPLMLYRGGTVTPVPAGSKLRLGRLDLLLAPKTLGVVAHSWLGRVELPAAHVIRVWDLSGVLGPVSRALAHKTLALALTGDEQAARLLEQALPFVRVELRAALAAQPNAAGAPRLRMLLAAFE